MGYRYQVKLIEINVMFSAKMKHYVAGILRHPLPPANLLPRRPVSQWPPGWGLIIFLIITSLTLLILSLATVVIYPIY